MKIKAYAKVNLALDVVRRREDGYHDLEMIMAPIALHDLLYVDVIDHGIEIDSNSYIMPKNEKNIMWKVAAKMMEKYNINKGVKIFCYKHIPSQAGLAGGSADGAAVMKAMNRLFKLGLTYRELAELGKEIGADIPFCIYNHVAFVGGIGEKIEFINHDLTLNMLLVKPKKGVSTPKCFQALKLDEVVHKDCQDMVDAINHDDYDGIIANLQNTLEGPAMEMVPEIQDIKDDLLSLGFDGALMSGSGSCVFGIAKDEETVNKAYTILKEKYYYVRKTKIEQKGQRN